MKITAGLPFKHTFALPDHSADDGWTLAGKLSDSGGSYELAEGLFESDGDDWTLSIPSTTTESYETGNCVLYLIATKDSSEEIAYEGPASVVALGSISHASYMVTQLEALSKELATKKYVTLTTSGGETITLDREGVEKQLAIYRKQLASEKRVAASGGRVRKIQCGFQT